MAKLVNWTRFLRLYDAAQEIRRAEWRESLANLQHYDRVFQRKTAEEGAIKVGGRSLIGNDDPHSARRWSK